MRGLGLLVALLALTDALLLRAAWSPRDNVLLCEGNWYWERTLRGGALCVGFFAWEAAVIVAPHGLATRHTGDAAGAGSVSARLFFVAAHFALLVSGHGLLNFACAWLMLLAATRRPVLDALRAYRGLSSPLQHTKHHGTVQEPGPYAAVQVAPRAPTPVQQDRLYYAQAVNASPPARRLAPVAATATAVEGVSVGDEGGGGGGGAAIGSRSAHGDDGSAASDAPPVLQRKFASASAFTRPGTRGGAAIKHAPAVFGGGTSAL